jgi:hypothetical protein
MASSHSSSVSVGFPLGTIVAGALSWLKWHSIGWALVHGLFCGWIYVIYFWLKYGFDGLIK